MLYLADVNRAAGRARGRPTRGLRAQGGGWRRRVHQVAARGNRPAHDGQAPAAEPEQITLTWWSSGRPQALALDVVHLPATRRFRVEPHDLKLRSCATLFACVLPPGSAFERILEKYYDGKRDERTLARLGISP